MGGNWAKLFMVNGRPCIAHVVIESPQANKIFYAYSNDATGTQWTSQGTSIDDGAFLDVATLADGTPVISYSKEVTREIRVAVGNSVTFNPSWSSVLVTNETISRGTSMSVPDGKLSVVWQN